jgi:hypothetical protein
MSETEIAERPIGIVTPLLQLGDGPSVADRLDLLSSNLADFDERETGWHEPTLVGGDSQGLRADWIRYDVLEGGLGDRVPDIEPTGLADLPLQGTDEGRVLLVGTKDDYRLGDIVERYVEAIGVPVESFGTLTIDARTLKLVFQAPHLYDSVRAVQSTERSFPRDYEGSTRLKSNPDFDVRDDPKFNTVLDQRWEMMKITPSMDTFQLEVLPPAVQLRAEGTFRLWKGWTQDETLLFIARFCRELYDLQDDSVEGALLEEAAESRLGQATLPDF